MKKPLIIFGVVVIAGIAMLFFIGGEDDSQELSVKIGISIGDKAPDFKVTTIDNSEVSSQSLRGQVVVITSSAAWCNTCVIEAQQFSPVYKKYSDKPVTFLTIDIDPRNNKEAIQQFRVDNDTPWDYTYERGASQLISDYKLNRFEITYIIDGEGIIRFKDSAITSSEKLSEELEKVLSGKELEELGDIYELQEAMHIDIDESHSPYNSNPPTSGWHYQQPAEWGIYQEELPDEQVVHNLEHGGVWVSYNPKISEEQKQFLENLLAGYTTKIILSPRDKNDADLSLVAWGRILELQAPLVPEQEDIIIQFIETYKNKGPEFIPD